MNNAETATTPDRPAAEPAADAARGASGIRELLDELVLVFVLVMFLKTFLVEHYKIPTGSMTPTLLGGQVAYVAFDDGLKGLAYWSNLNESPLVYVKRDGRYLLDRERRVDTDALVRARKVREEFDHVLVSRLAYWFHPPRRGDVVVFKVPPEIFKPDSPIYIKRLVGEPGDTISFTNQKRLTANGQVVERPAFFQTQHYINVFTTDDNNPNNLPKGVLDWRYLDPFTWKMEAIHVPPDQAYVFGDNSTARGSWDSRYWGGVPLDNFKGRAFVRVWPLPQLGFLK